MALNYEDEWGRDPSVRIMRQVFSRMEAAQKQLLEQLGISPLDPRLRKWRDRARELLEGAWAEAMGSGMLLDEEKACNIYIRSLCNIMVADGVHVPGELLP